mmetsp:Transcript_44197/g.87164  ORF Transcript_44197/g.87164 Transcript_44197/m.87164 type:complete len:169 (-) Transcript_44197:515-1021(-)
MQHSLFCIQTTALRQECVQGKKRKLSTAPLFSFTPLPPHSAKKRQARNAGSKKEQEKKEGSINRVGTEFAAGSGQTAMHAVRPNKQTSILDLSHTKENVPSVSFTVDKETTGGEEKTNKLEENRTKTQQTERRRRCCEWSQKEKKERNNFKPEKKTDRQNSLQLLLPL